MDFKIKDGVLQSTSLGRDEKEIVIPEGVTVIGENAFNYCYFESVTIPEGVKEIKKNAFFGCESLKTVDIPASVEKIDFKAFSLCKDLSELRISENNKKYCLVDKAVYSKNKKNLFIISANADEEFNVPEGVQIIGNEAFCCCSNLKRVTIPASVKSIAKNAFMLCYSLESITVDDKNAHYSSADGALIDSAKSRLILVPKAKKSVEIPEGVTSIDRNAFDCMFLKSVKIPDSIFYFPKGIFERCNSLNTMTMRGVTFHYWCYVPASDVAEVLVTNNYSVKMENNTKFSIAAQVFLKKAQPEAEDYIKKNALKIIRHFIDLNEYDTVKGLLESGKFVTSRNIGKLIEYAIAHTQNGGDMQIQVLLTNYKHENFDSANVTKSLKL